MSDVFSGRDNFFSAYAPKADPKGLVDGLGERFEVSDTIIKKWSTGGPVQSPIDALVDLRQQHPFEVGDVQQVVVHLSTSAAPKVDNTSSPDLNLQYLVCGRTARRYVDVPRRPRRRSHERPGRSSDACQSPRRSPRTNSSDLLPKRVAVVEVTLNNGTRLTERNDTVRGTPENPMTRDEVTAKGARPDLSSAW